MMLRKILPVIVLATILYTPLVAQEQTTAPVPIYPEFDQIEHLLHQDNDTTYVINFWATWCKPCVEELPFFEKAYRAFENQPVKFIMVSLDFKKQIQSKLIPFLEKRPDMPETWVLLDQDGNSWIPKVDEVWDGAIPVTLFYKGDKRVFVGESFDDYEQLQSIIQSFF
ncbi:MAG: redoxin domain-containing protein [Phaeodactylibacter sp.]|nr:redoxin domain-containing protein [Phaeodactylibacter sp.]